VENAYARAVQRDGNQPAQNILNEVFEICDRQWRGIGLIEQSGWQLRESYRAFDAAHRFNVHHIQTTESPLCRSGDVLLAAAVMCCRDSSNPTSAVPLVENVPL